MADSNSPTLPPQGSADPAIRISLKSPDQLFNSIDPRARDCIAGSEQLRSDTLWRDNRTSSIAAVKDGLLLIGMKLSQRPPHSQHPFGCSQEIYIWSMIVSIVF